MLLHEPVRNIARVEMLDGGRVVQAPVVFVDTECPSCFWPERLFNTRTRKFGCHRCTYKSDEHDA